MSGLLSGLRAALTAQLAARPELEGIPVLSENLQDIASQIEQAVAELGICLVVRTVGGSTSNDTARGPQLDVILPVVRICENPALNTTAWQASDLAEFVVSALHGLALSSGLVLTAREGATITLVPDDSRVIYDASFLTGGELPSQLLTAAAPVLTVADGLLTAVCATPGAALYYTTDSSEPWPDSAAAILYTVPFAAPDQLQVRAFRWGQNPSPITTL